MNPTRFRPAHKHFKEIVRVEGKIYNAYFQIGDGWLPMPDEVQSAHKKLQAAREQALASLTKREAALAEYWGISLTLYGPHNKPQPEFSNAELKRMCKTMNVFPGVRVITAWNHSRNGATVQFKYTEPK